VIYDDASEARNTTAPVSSSSSPQRPIGIWATNSLYFTGSSRSDRFISVAVPRMRDFRGLPTKSFDGRGNYSIGIREQIIFPEVDYDDVETVRGLDVTITTSADTDEEAFALLRELGLPFRAEA